MMMMLHLPFILSLFALAMGVCLYVWAVRNDGAGVNVAKYFGLGIMVMSIVSIICIWYTLYSFQAMNQMPMNMMQNRGTMNQGNTPNNVPHHPQPPKQ